MDADEEEATEKAEDFMMTEIETTTATESGAETEMGALAAND